jgi:Kef-type K+ transport system membrane component KefB
VQERGIHKTKIRCIVITRAAADDITAWCILAVVIAIVKATFVSSLYIIMLAVLYVIAMIYIVKPFLKGVEIYGSKDTIIKPVVVSFSGAYYFVLCYRSDWDSFYLERLWLNYA